MTPIPLFTDEERAARRRSTDAARGSIFLSGFTLSPEAEAITERYVAGELDPDEFVAAIKRSTELPKPQ
jgi:hypothetical protein